MQTHGSARVRCTFLYKFIILLLLALGGGLAQAQDPTATPGLALEVRVSAVTSNSIALEWTPLQDVYYYSLTYYSDKDYDNPRLLDLFTNRHTAKGLLANADYKFWLSAYLKRDGRIIIPVDDRVFTIRTSGQTPTPIPEATP